MQLITIENINDLKSNEEIFFYDETTQTFVKLNTYDAILEEKSKQDGKRNEALAKYKGDRAQAENDGPIGAPKVLAVVVLLLENKNYNFAFYKLQKIRVQTGGEVGGAVEIDNQDTQTSYKYDMRGFMFHYLCRVHHTKTLMIKKQMHYRLI